MVRRHGISGRVRCIGKNGVGMHSGNILRIVLGIPSCLDSIDDCMWYVIEHVSIVPIVCN